MRERIITIATALALASALSAQAGLETFFGEYVSPYPVGGINQVPRPTNIVAVLDAQNRFRSRLSGVLTESFETFPTDSSPTVLTFGTNTATLSGDQFIGTVPDPTQTDGGGFPLTGTNLLTLPGSRGEFFTVTFSTPQAAFGFFGSDIELNRLRLTLVSTNGQRRHLDVPVTVPQGSGGCFYFAVLDRISPFIAVEFSNIGSYTDGFAFDDMVIAVPEQVLPPRLSIRVSQVEICWDSVTNEIYQLQYRSSLTSNVWFPFGGTVVGDGSRFCTNDAVLPGQPQRFYQLVVTNAP